MTAGCKASARDIWSWLESGQQRHSLCSRMARVNVCVPPPRAQCDGFMCGLSCANFCKSVKGWYVRAFIEHEKCFTLVNEHMPPELPILSP